MYAIKEATLAKEHSHEPLDVAIFYMDMRTFGKDFEKYYEKAKTKGIRFIRSRVHSVDPLEDGGLNIRYVTEDGQVCTEEFDLVVLSVGLEISQETVELAKILGVEVDHYNFARTSSFAPVATSRPGIYVCGVFTAPKDIPLSVMEASAAASAASSKLALARKTLVKEKVIPAERNVVGDPPRIGVFVCCCGINIGGIVRVPEVVEYARTLPFVDYVEKNLFTCSQDTQTKMTEIIEANKLNRIVVAACTPRTHEPLFQETLIGGGLNKYLFEMANIRNQDSWVHSGDPDGATAKGQGSGAHGRGQGGAADALIGDHHQRDPQRARHRRRRGRAECGPVAVGSGLSRGRGGKEPAVGRPGQPAGAHGQARGHPGLPQGLDRPGGGRRQHHPAPGDHGPTGGWLYRQFQHPAGRWRRDRPRRGRDRHGRRGAEAHRVSLWPGPDGF